MPDGATLKFDTRQLEANLQQIPAALEGKIVRPALQAGGEVIKAAAEITVHRVTGELAEDIVIKVHVNTSGDFRDNYVLVGPGYDRAKISAGRNGRVSSSNSPGVYGKFVEVGHGPPGSAADTRTKARRGLHREFGSGHGDTPPHPWLRPAFEESKDAALEAMAEVMRVGLVGVAAGLQK